MLKKFLWALLGVLVAVPIGAALAGVKVLQFKAMGDAAAKMVMPPEPVTVFEVEQAEWQPFIASIGSVVAVQGTDVSAEAEGVVRQIKFEPGSEVKAGDELVQLDVDVEKAQLRAAEAAAELALSTFKRTNQLADGRSISQQENDSAEGELKQALAQVENLRAVIAKKTVRAPFAGKLGISTISVGEFLEKGKPVVSLQALDPVYVEFSLPQQRLAEVKEGQTVRVLTDAYAGEKFEGKITAINPNLDAKTRNIRLQATLQNQDRRLRPGMYVEVETVLSTSSEVMLIPATAVQFAPYGDSVFVVEEAKEKSPETTSSLTVRQQFVRLGDRQGDFVIAKDGVKPGDKVVSTGGFKLRPGGSVVIDNTLAPKFELNPKPKNT